MLIKAHCDTIRDLGKSIEDDLRAKYKAKEEALENRFSDGIRDIKATHDAVRITDAQKFDNVVEKVENIVLSIDARLKESQTELLTGIAEYYGLTIRTDMVGILSATSESLESNRKELVKSVKTIGDTFKSDMEAMLSPLATSAPTETHQVSAGDEKAQAMRSSKEKGRANTSESEESESYPQPLKRLRVAEPDSFAELVERISAVFHRFAYTVECIDGPRGVRPNLGDVFFVLAYMARSSRSIDYLLPAFPVPIML
ncbi:hypothetical protein QBC39DRAFT_353014 [Podospora conica]|nr:hypothetical protein QBC39DRAFT_353014 [Schizothecium conicum]